MFGSSRRIPRIWIIATIVFVALSALWWSHTAQATGQELKGRIEAMPASGLLGEWVIAGRTFLVTEATRIREDKGPVRVGVCVEVEYTGDAAPFLAKKIATKSDDDCDDSPPPSEREAFGIVQSKPVHGLIGAWTIGGVAYQTYPGTEFKQRHGPLVVGACAKVHFSGTEEPFRVREMESRPLSDCGGNGTVPPPPPPPGPQIERFGRIDSFPEGLIGEWVVDGVRYTATSATEFKQKNGAFAVGVCVKLHAFLSTNPPTLREIKTERDHKCNNSGDGNIIGKGELFGEVQSFPDGLIGEWNIAGITFVADSATKFEQKHGAFAVGVLVKVKFVIRLDGTFYAREIETKSGVRLGRGHAFGVVESMPEGRIGVWTISGVEYQVTAQTRLREKHGALQVGAKVRVKYVVDANGQRTALKIETTRSNGGASRPNHFKTFGFVDQMPPDGLIGQWTINNALFIADARTKFKETNGLLGVGAYVSVEYQIINGQRIIHELETKVPPGAGTLLKLAQIEARPEVAAAAADGSEVWRIGGVDYLITPATDIDDLESGLEVGDLALVNSYEEADGTLVATEVRGVNISSRIYLPTVNR
jgi:hypothetical protein